MTLVVDQADTATTLLARHLGIKVAALQRDEVVAGPVAAQKLCTLHSWLHGGEYMALADHTAAVATAFNQPENAQGTTTIESKISFLAAASVVSTGRAVASPLYEGRRTQVRQTRIWGASEQASTPAPSRPEGLLLWAPAP